MRIGLLPFGRLDATTLLTYLRDRDVDVVTTEQAVDDARQAGEEAGRLARADTDGVVLLLDADADPRHIGPATLRLPSPLLLAGPLSPNLAAGAGVLAEIGVPFDRLLLIGDGEQDGEALRVWLAANEKRERQRGIEAARKLYGQRITLTGAISVPIDPAQLQRQFGMTLAESGADVTHPNADPNDALTTVLLKAITGEEPQLLLVTDDLPEGGTGARFSRVRGRYACQILRAPSTAEERVSFLLSATYRAVPGNQVAALKAACETLDVSVNIGGERPSATPFV